jgi:hypothetical protein
MNIDSSTRLLGRCGICADVSRIRLTLDDAAIIGLIAGMPLNLVDSDRAKELVRDLSTKRARDLARAFLNQVKQTGVGIDERADLLKELQGHK